MLAGLGGHTLCHRGGQRDFLDLPQLSMQFCVCVFCLRAERQVDLTVAELYLVGIGYKLRLCSSFMLEISPGKVADGAEILTFNILRIFLFTLKRVFFN